MTDMKRIIILFLVVSGFAVSAQAPKWGYGDTIMGQDAPDTSYFYQWWCQDWGDMHRTYPMILAEGGIGFSRAMLQYNYTDTVLPIAGVAVAYYYWDNITNGPLTSFREPEYVQLYDATQDSLVLKAQAEILLDHPCRYMYLDYCNRTDIFTGNCDCVEDNSFVFPIYEYYFDKPIGVDDSFYVGMTTNYEVTRVLELHEFGPPYFTKVKTLCTADGRTCPSIPYQQQLILQDLNHGGANVWLRRNEFLLMFPLLEPSPEAKCPHISGFHVENINDDRQPLLAWNSNHLHTTWEVSFGPAGTEPNMGTIYTTDTPTILLDSIENNTHYVAYVRAYCEYQGFENYTEWSDGIDVYRRWVPDNPPDTTQPQNFYTPDADDNSYVALMPNPASTRVQVISGYALKGYDLLDMNGRKLQSDVLEGHTATINVSEYAKGVYLLHVRTANGIAVKRLVVE